MKAISSLVVVLCVAGIAMAQEAVQLGQTQPVDLKVTDINWHPNGKGIIYTRELETGIGLGTYVNGKFAGKVVLELGKTDTYSTYWFHTQAAALVIVHSEVAGQSNSTQVRIYLVDAETQSAKQLFSEVYEKKILPNFEIDTSPLLKHAIVKMSLNNQVRHLVLCQGTATLVPSPDLDRAAKQGLNGPSWSVDGTAVYGEFPNNKIVYLGGAKVITTDSQSEVEALTAQNTIRISEVVLTFDKSDRSEAVVTSRLAVFKPTPEKGSAVLELMPSNPVLRPVKFRGPWSFSNMMKLPLSSKNHPILLTYGKSSQQDHSVWLKRGTDPSAPGTLLAVHASKVWIDPAQTGVAYLIDGALFFRTINEAK